MAQSSSTSREVKRGGFLRKLFRFTIVMMLLLAVGAGIAFWLVKQTPAHVEQTRRVLADYSDEELRTIATNFENRLFAEISRVDIAALSKPGADGRNKPVSPANIGDIKKINVTLLELNAWLRTRLPELEANQKGAFEIPDQATEPGLAIVDQQLVLFFNYEFSGQRQWISAYMDIELQEDGKARLAVDQVNGGKLPVPAGVARAAVGEAEEGPLASVRKALDGKTLEPLIDPDDNDVRRGRVVNFSINDDSVDLSILIEAKKGKVRAAQVPER